MHMINPPIQPKYSLGYNSLMLIRCLSNTLSAVSLFIIMQNPLSWQLRIKLPDLKQAA